MISSGFGFVPAALILINMAFNPGSALAQQSGEVAENADEASDAETLAAIEAANVAKAAVAAQAIAAAVAKSEAAAAYGEYSPGSEGAVYAKQVANDLAAQDTATTQTADIELRSFDGLVSVTGVILDFDDALITIDSPYGIVGIENEQIECIGAACPPELLKSP